MKKTIKQKIAEENRFPYGIYQKYPPENSSITFNDVKDKAAKFSDFAFGKNRTALMPLAKLQEEIEELKECLEKGKEPDSEYADLLLILIDSFRKYYGDDVDMQYWLDACSEKLDINYTRDWKFHEEDKVFRHVKECEKSPTGKHEYVPAPDSFEQPYCKHCYYCNDK
jgi:hypothetical protein